MSYENEYISALLSYVREKNPDEPEFCAAVGEVFESLEPILKNHPEYIRGGVLLRLTEPERLIKFRISWIDDGGRVHVNRGFRVQFEGSVGTYKGGLRFHPSVNESIIKFLGFEQTLKNALTGFSIGGGKGGADFDPKGKSDTEIMSFCRSFMCELSRYVGADTDVPAGDIGVGEREIGYLFGAYRRIRGEFCGAITGKGLSFGGIPMRREATGYGLCYFLCELLAERGENISGKKIVISGSGNVALHAARKAHEMGACVVAMSDSDGFVADGRGLDIDIIEAIKKRRGRISEYAELGGGEYRQGSGGIWSVPCDIALPCATQNELDAHGADLLLGGGCIAVAEGANMPCTPDAVATLRDGGVLFAPSKAANAGGVAVSALEMTQNATHYPWSAERVDSELRKIMKNIYALCSKTSCDYGRDGDLVFGANAAGFLRVAEAMRAQGV